uniref:hypothetical protein n=1 Tax=uncultured Draconibacterium sp. TaxID=1573823 RepID=UPI0032180CB9
MSKKQTDSEIIQCKEYGDMAEVARTMNISRHNATMILRRPTSKRYKEAIGILRELVEARQARQERTQDNN